MQPQGPSFPSALAQLQTPAFTDKSKKTLLISDMNPCSVWRVHLDVPQTSQPTGLSQCPHFPQIPRLLWSPLPRKWQPLSSTLISSLTLLFLGAHVQFTSKSHVHVCPLLPHPQHPRPSTHESFSAQSSVDPEHRAVQQDRKGKGRNGVRIVKKQTKMYHR